VKVIVQDETAEQSAAGVAEMAVAGTEEDVNAIIPKAKIAMNKRFIL
jgi:hypothetical protein